MSYRLVICPLVGDGQSRQTAFRPKVAGQVAGFSMVRDDALGAPGVAWCMCIAHADDWTAIELDVEVENVFAIDLPDTLSTRAEFIQFLRSRTVGDIPPVRRAALQTRLTARGVNLEGIDLESTWLDVVRRIMRRLQRGL